ncbi:helix-turn-helix domain-containing protein [Robertmurraya massiliosenegalensis]|uniref:helix-turn-helix domain-containing protein n=1 Tax=Robertmurraya massiliosenegalensis TaxID=1287657 RepID=UPI0002F7E0B1|nr:helix-turn-helix transcriptional regulator [Robertmurraya massiliosenegalensis]
MEFKDKVRNRRLELGLTLEDVAKAVGVSAPTIQRYESGEIKNIRKDKIKALSDALRVTPSFLMDWEETAEAKQSFDYFLEMQLRLLGYEIVYDEENGYVVLVGKEGTFEISESDVEDLSNNLKSFLNFKIYDLMQNSRKIDK